MASGPVEYAVISEECWSMPPSINVTLAKHGMVEMTNQHIIYGGSLSYRHMCRFNSGSIALLDHFSPRLETKDLTWMMQAFSIIWK